MVKHNGLRIEISTEMLPLFFSSNSAIICENPIPKDFKFLEMRIDYRSRSVAIYFYHTLADLSVDTLSFEDYKLIFSDLNLVRKSLPVMPLSPPEAEVVKSIDC